jgi:diaminohydroxyphosphoribosylaminopyrimidine deaminase/5-amino-6-(5-phosphoribosylamino)uracil reductase
MIQINEIYMQRALQLARLGEIGAHPNPMVGAVLVDDATGAIVGEGYHRQCGKGHAEVNAVADAESRNADLTAATLYVTLEPCAHYGKTPPCAQLIIDRKIPRVVIGTVDPFAKVQGRGIEMLRRAGVEVAMIGGEAERECRALNVRFFTAHTHRSPYVVLKWAQSADGFIDRQRTSPCEPAAQFSTAATRALVHRLRSTVDAIAVGSNTERLDCPRLDARHWPDGRAPQRVTFSRIEPLSEQLQRLYAEQGITSLLVEGGAMLLGSFLAEGTWDELRVETSPLQITEGVAAPALPSDAMETESVNIGANALKTYKNARKINGFT